MSIHITKTGVYTETPQFALDVEHEGAIGKTDGTNGLYVRGRLDFKAILASTIPVNGLYVPIANTLTLTTNSVNRIVVNTATIDCLLLTRVTAGSGYGIDTVIAGDLYIGQNNAADIYIGNGLNTVTINSNLNVIGDITYIETTDLQVHDKNIEINKDSTTALASGAGITVLGDLNAAIASFLYDPTLASKWKVGTNASQSEIVTAGDTQTVYNKTVADLSLLKTNETGAGSLDDVDTDNKALIRLTVCSAVTGLANGYDGKVIDLINASTYPVLLKHQDTGSLAANRIYMESLHEITLPIDGCIKLVYDAAITSWRPYSSSFYGFIPDWSTDTFYSVGQTMMSVGLGGKRKVWRCIVAHLSTAIITDINNLYWEIAGGGGSSTIDVIAGQSLTKGQSVYVCYSGSDTGRTIGQCYVLETGIEYRKNYVGIIEADVLAGNSASIVVSGAVDTIAGIVSLDMTKDVYGSTSPGNNWQSPILDPNAFEWRVVTAKPVSATQAVIAHEKPYRTGNTTISGVSASIVGLIMSDAEFTNYQRLTVEYVAGITTGPNPSTETGSMTIMKDTITGLYEMAATGVGYQHCNFDINTATGQVSVADKDAGTGAISWRVKEVGSGIF